MRLTYLAVDSLQEGVGASQILPYVEGLARAGVDVRLHTFEKRSPATNLINRLRSAGVDWTPAPFGRHGTAGGVLRVLAGRRAARHAEIVHARSDLPAASVLLARAHPWVWDVRSLYIDQKIELGEVQRGSPQETILRSVERAAARKSSAIVTLTKAVLPILDARHGLDTSTKAQVITTCVDLSRFHLQPSPRRDPITFLLAGTLNRYYDVPLMTRLIEHARNERPTALDVVSPDAARWESTLAPAKARIRSARPEQMPEIIAESHVGLCVCRRDAGISLAASMPTKIGEFLASGRPVIVNEDLGDAEELLVGEGCGVAIRNQSSEEIDRVLKETWNLLDDPDTPSRCRGLAENHFDLEKAIHRLLRIYRTIAAS